MYTVIVTLNAYRYAPADEPKLSSRYRWGCWGGN